MGLKYGAQHELFREGVRAFLASEWDPSCATNSDYVDRFRLNATKKGFLYRSIPKRYGGSEQAPDVLRAQIFAEEFTTAEGTGEVTGRDTMMVVPVHGGIGYTCEYPLHIFMKRTMFARTALGRPAQHRRRSADLAGW